MYAKGPSRRWPPHLTQVSARWVTFKFRIQKEVVWFQIWRIWSMVQQFVSQFHQFGHGDQIIRQIRVLGQFFSSPCSRCRSHLVNPSSRKRWPSAFRPIEQYLVLLQHIRRVKSSISTDLMCIIRSIFCQIPQNDEETFSDCVLIASYTSKWSHGCACGPKWLNAPP